MTEQYTLVQLMDSGHWIFDSNYENALHMTRESLDLIFLFLLVKNKLKIFKHPFPLLYSCARQETSVLDKYEDVSEMTILNCKIDKKKGKMNLYIDI